MGDVAMTVPLVDSLARQYPSLEICVLTRGNFEPMFRRLPENVRVRGIDLKAYKGLGGLGRLYGELCSEGFTHVADLHDVLRTKYLRMRFRLSGCSVACIDKGRADKRRLTRVKHKVFKPLESSFARYQKVFEKLGFCFEADFNTVYGSDKADISGLRDLTGEKGSDKWIGIAPFAGHDTKVYLPERQREVVDYFRRQPGIRVFVFGGGKREKELVDEWKKDFPEITSVIGALNMEQELALMSRLDVLLSMDSGNMHLASLVGTPVVSVWGATHPFAGFMGWGQSLENAVQADLPCRPCSVFGEKSCYRKDFACMHAVRVEEIIARVERVLGKYSQTKQ